MKHSVKNIKGWEPKNKLGDLIHKFNHILKKNNEKNELELKIKKAKVRVLLKNM